MRLELAQKHFDEGWGIFDLGCVMSDAAGAEFEIVRFSGVSEIDDTDGTENENINRAFWRTARRWSLRH